ncbi:antitoxin Xre/MbcA/ParS toxin-binding domain-containing protein [Pseudomonas sp. NPDC089569]|uniref:antitoxin Xre/MbcA/ParS toxin-binding domain-containing protein n=1 Tax=Pseudomonas sp. NPDC089569 TaxID=3390722 RepID=UPI003D0446BF
MNYVEQIQLEAKRVFANKQKADAWLNQPKADFDDCTPLEIARDESGYLRVKDVLDRIDHGYSF